MLYLTKTESRIVEILKEGPKSSFDIEQGIDHAKSFGEDYVKILVFKINKTRRIIESYNENGVRMYRLVGQSVEYEILDNLSEAIEELQTIKYLACDTCAFKSAHDLRKKTNMILAGVGLVLAVIVFLLGYYVGAQYGDVTVELDNATLQRLTSPH